MSDAVLRNERDAPSVVEKPVLEPGNRLTRAQFEPRYDAMPQVKKAELIEGVVHRPSPGRLYRHGRPNQHLITWLGTYEAATPGTIAADNTSVRLDMDNEPQPDGILFIEPDCGGQVRISDGDYVEGGPELVAEVTSSTVSYDLGNKLQIFRRHGVLEYVVWRVLDREIDWFRLREGRCDRLIHDDHGHFKSETFPGLWLDVDAMLRGDLAGVLATLKEGLAMTEHRAFVDRLKRSPSQ